MLLRFVVHPRKGKTFIPKPWQPCHRLVPKLLYQILMSVRQLHKLVQFSTLHYSNGNVLSPLAPFHSASYSCFLLHCVFAHCVCLSVFTRHTDICIPLSIQPDNSDKISSLHLSLLKRSTKVDSYFLEPSHDVTCVHCIFYLLSC